MPQSGCGPYILKGLPAGTDPKVYLRTFVVDSRKESDLKLIAEDDACRYTYNAAASFLGAIKGLHTQQAAWAVTKLYYTVFYAGRAALCRANHVIFHAPRQHSGHTQFELSIKVGEVPSVVSKPPSTHKLVAERFRTRGYPQFMAALQIQGQDPFHWLMDQREYWQYRAARFSDPDMPPTLALVDLPRIQRLLAEYNIDGKGVFISDPEHALLAIPFRLMVWSLSQRSLSNSAALNFDDLRYLRNCCRIGNQTLTELQKLIG